MKQRGWTSCICSNHHKELSVQLYYYVTGFAVRIVSDFSARISIEVYFVLNIELKTQLLVGGKQRERSLSYWP